MVNGIPLNPPFSKGDSCYEDFVLFAFAALAQKH